MRSVRKELRLTPEMDAAVEAAKGDVSFNRFVERALERVLEGHQGLWVPTPATVASREGTSADHGSQPSSTGPPAGSTPETPSRASGPRVQTRQELAMERQRLMNERRK